MGAAVQHARVPRPESLRACHSRPSALLKKREWSMADVLVAEVLTSYVECIDGCLDACPKLKAT